LGQSIFSSAYSTEFMIYSP